MTDESEKMENPKDKSKEYVIESIDTDLITYIAEESDKVWAQILACKDTDELEELFVTLANKYSPEMDLKVERAVSYTILEPEFENDGVTIKVDKETQMPVVPKPTVEVIGELQNRDIIEVDENGNETVVGVETYVVYYKKINPYQLYYRWMNTYKFLPAGFAG
jgi:hypothetical protein